MVKLDTTLAKGIEPIEGKAYKITEVEEIKTSVQGFKGIRVRMEPTKRDPADKNEYATMLWSREEAGIQSKLGAFIKAFIDALGDEEAATETSNWIGKTIRVTSWKQRNREIEVLE